MKLKTFEQLTQKQQQAYEELPLKELLLLRNVQNIQIEKRLCAPLTVKANSCTNCPVSRKEIELTGWSGPLACSLIRLILATRGYYKTRYRNLGDACAKCKEFITEDLAEVQQFGVSSLTFCMKCVGRSKY